MATVQHISYKWLVIMWIVIGALSAALVLTMARQIGGFIPPAL